MSAPDNPEGWNFQTFKAFVLALFEAIERAVEKAEIATEKRFDAVNEFRAQLSDQAQTFTRREEMDEHFKSIEDKIADLKASRDKQGGGTEISKQNLTAIVSVTVAIAAVLGLFYNIMSHSISTQSQQINNDILQRLERRLNSMPVPP